MTPRARAVERVARLESLSHAQAGELVDDILDAVGYDALLAERDRLLAVAVAATALMGTAPGASTNYPDGRGGSIVRHEEYATLRAVLDRWQPPDPAAGDGGTA